MTSFNARNSPLVVMQNALAPRRYKLHLRQIGVLKIESGSCSIVRLHLMSSVVELALRCRTAELVPFYKVNVPPLWYCDMFSEIRKKVFEFISNAKQIVC